MNHMYGPQKMKFVMEPVKPIKTKIPSKKSENPN
jgi:hypothetical protein